MAFYNRIDCTNLLKWTNLKKILIMGVWRKIPFLEGLGIFAPKWLFLHNLTLEPRQKVIEGILESYGLYESI